MKFPSQRFGPRDMIEVQHSRNLALSLLVG